MKKLLLTMAAGRYRELTDVIYPLFKGYADRCGADFESIENIQHPECPVLDKLRLTSYFSQYDRILFLDADILVRLDAPSLFDLVPRGKMACYDEGSTLHVVSDMALRMHHVNLLAQQWKLEPPNWPVNVAVGDILPYYNSGVVLLDAEHQCIFDKPAIEPLTKPQMVCGEQAYMNWGVRKHKPRMHHLQVCFNQMPYNRSRDYLHTAYFSHYAGYSSFDMRASDMRADYAKWKSMGFA